jgi:hypothetical protein
VIAIADRESPSDILESASTAPTSIAPDPTLPPESAPPEAVPPDTVPPQTLVAELSPTAIAQGEFVDFVQRLPQEEIKNKEGRDLLTKIYEAIAAATAGETNEAIDKLTDVANGIDEHIKSAANREVAFGLLVAVSDSLGFDPDALFDEQT